MEQIITGIIASTITAGAVIVIVGIGELLGENTGVQNLITGFRGTSTCSCSTFKSNGVT